MFVVRGIIVASAVGKTSPDPRIPLHFRLITDFSHNGTCPLIKGSPTSKLPGAPQEHIRFSFAQFEVTNIVPADGCYIDIILAVGFAGYN